MKYYSLCLIERFEKEVMWKSVQRRETKSPLEASERKCQTFSATLPQEGPCPTLPLILKTKKTALKSGNRDRSVWDQVAIKLFQEKIILGFIEKIC